MQRKDLITLLLSMSVPLSSAFAQDLLKVDLSTVSSDYVTKAYKKHKLIINTNLVDEDKLISDLLQNVSVDKPESMVDITAAVVFGNETQSTVEDVLVENETYAVIVVEDDNERQLMLNLLEGISTDTPLGMEGNRAAVVFGNGDKRILIQDKQLMDSLLDNITLDIPETMKGDRAAVVFGMD
jgi:hypothetical protein